MHRVLEHIDRHLDEPLELDTLAAVANFSSFHFHRLFSAWMGETLGDYLRRRRLEMAALRLVSQPELPVLHVALSTGFGSAEAFARAFKARFGRTPTAWRSAERAKRTVRPIAKKGHKQAAKGAKSNLGQTNSNLDQAEKSRLSHHVDARKGGQEANMKVKVVDRQPTPVAYFRHTGPYGNPISEFWQQSVYPWMVTNNLLGRPRFGVSLDDPQITAPDKCRYDACVEVETDFVGAGKHLSTTIPGGKYAVTRFEGTAAHIAETWASLLRDWLPTSGMQLDSRPFFEYYSPEMRFDPRSGAFECDLCVPVAPL
jgi:AraC family transcriptional regulator